jgi:hypothetical protein
VWAQRRKNIYDIRIEKWVSWSSILSGSIAPADYSSCEVDGIKAVIPEDSASRVAAGSTPAIHQIGVFLLELPQAHLDIRERHMDGVGNAGRPPLPLRAHVYQHQLRIAEVLFHHLLRLGRTHAHPPIIIHSIGKKLQSISTQNLNIKDKLKASRYSRIIGK